jgi:hypothetical protein
MSQTNFNRIASVVLEDVTIKDLAISFKIEKTDKPSTNTAEITVHNLSETRRNLLTKYTGLLILNIGYSEGEGEAIAFTGTVTKCTHEIDGTEIKSVLECHDGALVFKNLKISTSFPAGSTVKTILGYLNSKIGVPLKHSLQAAKYNNKVYPSGFTACGDLNKTLSIVCKDAGLKWSIQNNQLVYTSTLEKPKTFGIVLNSQTGLIGTPERLNDESDAKVKIEGYTVKTLLNTKLEPHGLVKLESITAKGDFEITKATHEGETHGSEWTTTIEVTAIKLPTSTPKPISFGVTRDF